MNKPQTFDEYFSMYSIEIQEILEKIRKTIQQTAPNAKECISYSMPAFKQNGVLVYFAVCKNHIGFYPTPSGIENFKKELSKYKTSKGAVQFSLNEEIPYNLIAQITEFRAIEDLENVKKKKC